MHLYGGFAGYEDPSAFQLNQRDLVANETIVDATGKGHGIIIAQPASIAQVDYVVDGITVRNANALAYPDAVPVVDGAPESSNGTFAQRGGGFMAYAQPVIGDTRGGTVPAGALVPRIALRNCQVTNCVSQIGGGGYFDRALFTIDNCRVSNCSNQIGGGGFAFFTNDQGTATVMNCIFANNTCEGLWAGGGGAWVFWSSVNFDSCKFIGNSAAGSSTGGGLGVTIQTNNEATYTVNVTNCLFSDNMAPTGGALSCADYNGGPLNVMNCTFVNNTSNGPTPMGSAIMALAGSPLSVVNSIFSGNSGGNAIDSVEPATANYCLFNGNSGGNFAPTVTATNVLVADPMFVSASDFHLQSSSPAINAGTSVGAPTLDIEGNARQNAPDVGAYEFIASLVQHTIAASAGPGGTITPSGEVSVDHGASQPFAIAPNANYQIADVVVDGVSVGALASYEFSNVTTTHTITASFSLVHHTITASAGPGGTITPSGAVSVAHGASQSFAIEPDANYQIADVLVDGVWVGAVVSYDFTNVTMAHTITASFSAVQHTITATAGPGGTITPSGAVGVAHGASQSFAIAPDAGYAIADVRVDGASVGAVGGYLFDNVTEAHAIDASFSLIPAGFTIPLGIGYNPVGPALALSYLAQSGCDDINGDGGSCTQIISYVRETGVWKAHIGGLPFNNYPIENGVGYFAKCTGDSTWTQRAAQIPSPLTIGLLPGYNAISLPSWWSGATSAEKLCQQINGAGGSVGQVIRYIRETGMWQAHINGLPFNDFAIRPGVAYFVKCSAAFDWVVRIPLKVTNVSQNAFSISWVGTALADCRINYGMTPALGRTAYDDRGQAAIDDTHHVTLGGLVPSTTYYFDIVTGGVVDNNGGQHYTAATGPDISLPPFDDAYGMVCKSDGGTPAAGTVVYAKVIDADGSGSADLSAELSCIVDESGFWYIPIGAVRTQDLSGYFSYSPGGGDNLSLEALGGGDGKTMQIIDTSADAPSPTMALELPGAMALKAQARERADVEASRIAASKAPARRCVISGIQVSNVSQNAFTVSWTTDEAANGSVEFGPTTKLGSRAWDVRGKGDFTTHYVTVQGIESGKQYFFDVASGATRDNGAGVHYSATTGADIGLPSLDSIYGSAKLADGSHPAEGAIVYVQLENGDGQGSPGTSSRLSGLVDADGFWSISFGAARTSDLGGYYACSPAGSTAKLEARAGGARGCALLSMDTASDAPAPDLVMKRTSVGKRPVANAGPDQTVAAPRSSTAKVTLDGSASTCEKGRLLTYTWSWLINEKLNNATGPKPTISLPMGTHDIGLIVNDGQTDSAMDSIVITVNPRK